MKKFYTLIMALPFVAFAQNIAVNGDMEEWTDGALTTWTSEEGTTISEETATVSEGSKAASFLVTTQSQGNTDFRQTVSVEAGTVYNVSVDIYQMDGSARARLYVGDYRGYSDPETLNEWQTLTYEYTSTEAGDIGIGLRFYDISDNWTDAGSTIIVDNFQMVSAGTATVTEVATIAELRAGNVGSQYTLTGEAVITMQQAYRGQKWIQDDTAAILIDDNDGVITTTYNMYDGITGITGQLGEYNGVMQFVPLENTAAASSTNNTVEPQELTIAEFNANIDTYESELVKFVEVTTDATGNWENGTNYTFATSDAPEDALAVRTNFYDVDYIGTELPTVSVDIVGIAGEFNGAAQMYPRMDADIEEHMSTNNVDLTAAKAKVYVANNQLNVVNFDAKEIKVYNLNGKVVANSNFVGQLPAGIYVAVMQDANGKTISVKFKK